MPEICKELICRYRQSRKINDSGDIKILKRTFFFPENAVKLEKILLVQDIVRTYTERIIGQAIYSTALVVMKDI